MPELSGPESSGEPTVVALARETTRSWHWLALIGVLLLGVFLHFFRLGQEGYAHLYYAAAVKSMLTGWRNFFFASFDPGGFVTVDKLPLGLWVQAASAALCGFSGISLLLPQALAGILSIALTYHLVRRVFGPLAGLLAALTLTVTPISIATNRNNTMDSQLVFVLLLAAWAISRATEGGCLRWLLLCTVLVGLGFNVKMLQAFMVLPAFYLLYLLAAPIRWSKRLLHLALATVALLVISLSWAMIVDLTPPEQRPYVSGSQGNSVLELIIEYNGMMRLLPGGLRELFERAGLPWPLDGQPGRPFPLPFSLRPLFHEIGEPGWLRLFNRRLGGQISWLLPLAGLGLFAAAWRCPATAGGVEGHLDRRHQGLLLWSAWLLPQVIFFSVFNQFHRYYLEMLAPAIAALVGVGMVALWDDYRRLGWRGWLLPLALVGGAIVEAGILADFPDWSRWLTPLVVGLCLAAAIVLVVTRLVRRLDRPAWTSAVAAVGVLALLVPPAVWAFIPVWYGGGDPRVPYAGPDLLTSSRRGDLPDIERLADYLLTNRGEATFLAATLKADTAAPIILATGEPVMALGGFSGRDPILTRDELAEQVSDGVVRFFWILPRAGRQIELTRWVIDHCTLVSPRLWQPVSPGPGRPPSFGPGRMPMLFDCALPAQ